MSSFVMDSSYTTWVKDDLNVQIDPRIDIHKFADGDDERGIYANADIPAQTTLAIVPFSSLLTIEQVKRVPAIAKLRSICREDDLLALMLFHEQHLGVSSKWSQHIALLPKEYHSIINHTEEELELIKGSNLYLIAKQWKQQVEEDFDALQDVLTKHGLKEENSIFHQFSMDKYLWCLSTIWSRFISIEKKGAVLRAMVPMVDFLNHHPKAQVGHAYNAADDKFYLFTGETFSAGKEIFLNYGHVPNSRLMMLYGFALLDNPFSSVDLWATMETSRSHGGSTKLSILQSLQLQTQSSFKLEKDKIPDELIKFLRVQHLDTNDLNIKSVADLCEAVKKPLSPNFERKVWEGLKEAVNGMLDAYSTNIEEDEMQLVELGLLNEKREYNNTFCHPMYHKKHSLIMIYTEKAVLQSILNQANKKIEILDRIVKAVLTHKET